MIISEKSPVYICLAICYLILGSCTTKQESRDWTSRDRDFLIEGLTASRDTLISLTAELSEKAWHFREDSSRWCIGEVVTHLALHDALYYRELRSTTALPQPTLPQNSLLDEDDYLMEYGEINPQNKGASPWYLDPTVHWCQPQQALASFTQTRDHYISFVDTTNANLRAYFSANGRGKKPYRDLHQLVMISVAHSQRHLQQIRHIKSAAHFPD